jgi:hypothetical protein
MVIKFFQLPINTPPLSNGDQFFLIAQKGMGEGHEMTIRTRGGEKNGKKGNKNKRKILARLSKGRKERARRKMRENEGVGTKEERKTKQKNKGKKKPNDGKKKENKKKGFHEMPHEFASLSRIHLALSNGDQNGFGHH